MLFGFFIIACSIAIIFVVLYFIALTLPDMIDGLIEAKNKLKENKKGEK